MKPLITSLSKVACSLQIFNKPSGTNKDFGAATLWLVLNILVQKLELEIQPLQQQFSQNYSIVHSFVHLENRTLEKEDKSVGTRVKIHSPALW